MGDRSHLYRHIFGPLVNVAGGIMATKSWDSLQQWGVSVAGSDLLPKLEGGGQTLCWCLPQLLEVEPGLFWDPICPK